MRKTFQKFGFCFGILCLAIAIVDAQEASVEAIANTPLESQSTPDPSEAKEDDAVKQEGKSDEPATSKLDWVKRARRVLDIAVEPRMSSEQNASVAKELLGLKPTNGGDPRLMFAFVMVSMFEKQWIDAQKQAVELLKSDPDYIPARVANARMLMLRDQRLPALAELELLAKGVSSPSLIVTPDQLISATSFLGLAVGYFEGPGKEFIKPTNLKSLIAAAEKIPSSLRDTYSQSRESVGQEYQVLVEKGEEALKELRETTQEKAEQLRAELDASREQTEKEVEAVKQRLEASFANASSAWNIAWSQSQAISRNMSSLQSQQGQLITSISLIRPPRVDGNGNVDRIDEQRYLNEKRRLDNLVFNLDTQLNQLSLQYDLARSSGMAAENRMNALRIQGQRLGMSLSAQNESFAKTDRMIRGKEQAAKKAEAKTSAGKMRQARSFNTYDDFNFYKEQSLLLESLPRD